MKSHSSAISRKSFDEKIDESENDAMKTKFKKDMNKQRRSLIPQAPKRQQLYYIYHLILNQRKFKYDAWQAFKYTFNCFKCCCIKKYVRGANGYNAIKDKSLQKDIYLNKGTTELFKDLDIVNLLEMINDFSKMKQIFFDEDDKFLLKLQKSQII